MPFHVESSSSSATLGLAVSFSMSTVIAAQAVVQQVSMAPRL